MNISETMVFLQEFENDINFSRVDYKRLKELSDEFVAAGIPKFF
ncbi:MAG: hypothetical protein ACLFN5_06090 [bacterium]